MRAGPSAPDTAPVSPVPTALRRVLGLAMSIGVVSFVGAVARGLWLMNGGVDPSDLSATMFGLGMLLFAAFPPALAVFFSWRMLGKAAALAPVGLGVRVGALLSFTVVVAALYATTLLEEAVWLDAQAGISYLFLPLVTLIIGAVSALCGAVIGGFIMRRRAR